MLIILIISMTILILLIVNSIDNSILNDNSSKLFYIYDWPIDLIDIWPVSYKHHRLSIESKFKSNYGLGETINKSIGLYHTHQYSLFLTFYYRLLESKYRTTNPLNAKYFFIPYDLGMDSTTRQSDGALCKNNCPYVNKVMNLLNNSIYFQKSNGSNHFIIHSINHMMLFYAHKGCNILYKLCYNCIKLSIDVFTSDLYRPLLDNKHLTNNWISIPFPSNYHMNYDVINLPWINNNKSHVVSYIGSSLVSAKLQKELRILLQEECIEQSNTCKHFKLDSHSSNVNIDYTLYSNSIFCLMPGGDFPTRKGFLDSMLSGCIPVTFSEHTAQLQWLWHWGSIKKAMECSIYIPRKHVINNTSKLFHYLNHLSKNETFIDMKRSCIHDIAYRMQYNKPSGSSQPIDDNLIKSYDKQDAVDVIVNRLLGN